MADETSVDQPTDYGNQELQRIMGAQKAGHYELQQTILEKSVTAAGSKVVNFAFSILDNLIILGLQGVFKVLDKLDPAFGTLASMVVGGLFDVEVDTSAFTNIRDSAGRKAISTAVGENLLKAFKGDQANVGPGELQPSTAAAEQYLGLMANLAIEGWTFDMLGGCIPFLHLEHLGALNEEMARVLGLGRMSRAILRPFVNTLIATPATWSVNKQYRPKMLSVPEAIAAWQRGDVDEGTVDEIGARDGLGDDAIAALKRAAIKTLSPADAYFLELAGHWQQQDVIDELRLSGRDDARAQLERNVLELQALHKFELELVTAAANAYAERKIDESTLSSLLSADTIDTRTLARLHEIAAQRRKVNVLHLTRGDVEAAIENGVLGVSDYGPWLEARGFGHDDAITLELLLQAKLNKLDDAKHARELATAQRAADRAAKLQAQQTKRDQVAAEHAHWTGTLGEAERLVVRNVMPASQYTQILMDHALSAGDAAALTAVAVADRDARAAAAQRRAELAAKVKAPTTSIAALEHAVLIGARSLEAFRAELDARHYGAADAQLLVDLVTRELADRAAQQAKRDALANAAGGKAIGLAQLEAAVLSGAATIDQYRARLVAAKYSATDIATLVTLLQSKLKDHAFALERRTLAEQRLEASHVSLANEEKAVVDGILTLADYTTWLAAHDFDASDQAIMTALLEEKLAKKAGGA